MAILNSHKKKKTITGVEITGNWLKIVQSSYGIKGREITKLIAREIKGLSDEQISRQIAGIFKSFGISKNYVVTSVARHQAAIRFLKLPSVDKEEISRMVDFHAVKEIPYLPQETIVDFQIIDFEQGGYSWVFLVIVHKDIVNRLLKIFNQAQIKIEKIMFSSQIVSKAYLKAFSSSEGTILLIDIDYSATRIEIVSRSNLIFSRSLSVGTKHLIGFKADSSESDPWIKLLEEISRSLEVCKRKNISQKIDKAVLLNPDIGSGNLGKIFAKKFSFPLEEINLLKELPLAKGVDADTNFKEKALSTACLAGLMLGPDSVKINLLPKEIQSQKSKLKQRKNYLTALVLVLAIICNLEGFHFKKMHEKKIYLRELSVKIDQIGVETKRVENMLKLMRIIRERLNIGGSSIEIIREVHKIIPQGISLSFLAFEGKERLTLKGASFVMSDVFKFGAVLESSPYFEGMKIKYVSRRKIDGKELTDFQITCFLSSFEESIQ